MASSMECRRAGCRGGGGGGDKLADADECICHDDTADEDAAGQGDAAQGIGMGDGYRQHIM